MLFREDLDQDESRDKPADVCEERHAAALAADRRQPARHL